MTEGYHNEELANIARDYYLTKLTISQISEKYNLSRYLISKALEEAQETGIVQIHIRANIERNSQLEARFRSTFGLKEAFILRDADTTSQDNERIVTFAADQLQHYISSSHYVGIGWGTTVMDTINHFDKTSRDNLTFVQLMGLSLKTSSPIGMTSLVQRAAAKFEADYLPLPAPLYVLNASVHHALKKEPAITPTLNAYDKIDLLFTGIGTIDSLDSTPIWRSCEGTLLRNVDRQNIVGMILGRPYDINGHIYDQVAQMAVGICHEEVIKVPIRFGIIKNKFKTRALLGALRTGLLTHLVISEGMATRVLKEMSVQ